MRAIPSFNETPHSQAVHQVASPLIAVRNHGEEFVSGSAVVIGQGFGLTAYHVLADFVERYEGTRDVEGQVNISFQILMYLSLDKGARFLPLKVMRVWHSEPLDLALLALGVPEEWPDDYIWSVPTISLLPPKAGERVAAFGFPNSRVSGESAKEDLTLTVDPRTSTGVVREVHHSRRDAFRLPFPTFRTDARFDGGMSGGPVFNENGHLCGLICSSLPPDNEHDEHVSYACTLWPMVAMQLDATPLTLASGKYYPLMQLFTSGVLNAVDLSCVSLHQEPSGAWSANARYYAREWDAGAA
jgi:hypothetical protein